MLKETPSLLWHLMARRDSCLQAAGPLSRRRSDPPLRGALRLPGTFTSSRPQLSRLGPDTCGHRAGGEQVVSWLDTVGQTGQ